jgi:hypothetical protein
MHLTSLLILALSTLSLAVVDIAAGVKLPRKTNPSAGGLIDLQPLDSKLLTDTNQYVPERRNKFHWEVQRPVARPCECAEPYCPGDVLDKQSVSLGKLTGASVRILTSNRLPTAGLLMPWLATSALEGRARSHNLRNPSFSAFPGHEY